MQVAIKIDDHLGIGDKIQFSHIPENIYHFTGRKVLDISNSWIFDHNPFVDRINKTNYDIILNLWNESSFFPPDGFKSHAERFFMYFNKKFSTNFKNPILRHPRLYAYENLDIQANRVIVHTTGKSETFQMTDEVIEHIRNVYKNYEIWQIGGLNDKSTPFKNMLGLSEWDTVRTIASSAIFIGVNSGMMNIAKCYPRVFKKILIPRDAESFTPMSKDNVWFDYNSAYFNYTKYDIGSTFSYLKI